MAWATNRRDIVREAESELPPAGCRAVVASKEASADAEQAHRALRVVGPQQVERDRPDDGRVVGRRLDGLASG